MDIEKTRKDFPVLQKHIKGRPLIYMDSACMSLKPRQVIDAVAQYYNEFPACAGRSNHNLSNRVEDARQKARATLQKFINAKKSEEIIFTRNTTEGLNLVTSSLGLGKGDVVMTTDREHNSNLLPAQMLQKRSGVEHRVCLSDNESMFSLDNYEDMLNKDIKLVSFVYTSNLDGYTLPVKEIVKMAHDNGSLVLLDAAQAAPHHEIDVRKLGADFLAFSGHKMLGPTGTGILYVDRKHYESGDGKGLQPFLVGGETVEWSTYEDHKFLKPPEKFEAGLQNYAGEIGLAAAADYLKKIGMDNIEKHEKGLTAKLHDALGALDDVRIVGVQDPEYRGGITSFAVDGMGYHDVAMLLDRNRNIATRSGQHCVHSWFKAHGIEGSVRASLYLYNTKEEVETLITALKEIIKLR
jgi:cysteine desulfurase/selenocysteine lyase